MAAKLAEIPTDQIDGHPNNPRVCFRSDVIEGIATPRREGGMADV